MFRWSQDTLLGYRRQLTGVPSRALVRLGRKEVVSHMNTTCVTAHRAERCNVMSHALSRSCSVPQSALAVPNGLFLPFWLCAIAFATP